MKLGAAQIVEFGEDAAIKFKNNETVTISVDGNDCVLTVEDVIINTEVKSDLALMVDGNTKIALVRTLTDELKQEGLMRDLLRRLQVMRKESGLEIEDRINLSFNSSSDRINEVFEK